MFDNKTAQNCWAGPKGHSTSLPTCSELQEGLSKPKPENIFDETARQLSSDELNKIHGHTSVDSVGYLTGDIYNGNTFDLTSLTVQIDVLNSDKSTDFTRTYNIQKTFNGLSNTKVIERTDISLKRGQSVEWSITSAEKVKQ
jgi:hypothetical protein